MDLKRKQVLYDADGNLHIFKCIYKYFSICEGVFLYRGVLEVSLYSINTIRKEHHLLRKMNERKRKVIRIN